MNAVETQRMLKADPDADFAFRRPTYHSGEWRPTFIRGLSKSGVPGTWKYSEIKRPGGDWAPANGQPLALVHSRELVPGETARAEAEQTRRDLAKRDDAQRRTWAIAKRLQSEHGIPARAEGPSRIVVGSDGFDALTRLLDSIAEGGTRDERTQGDEP